ncbi:SCO6880 family protein [Nocardiopsis halophila]|uniref:SCO6880 family protein n=1 Tax=Nocardiopsis halophila TaxID=141692 RepID=UPI00034A5157|nr:SCO6880 family protein [Nocardiopsis halophila]
MSRRYGGWRRARSVGIGALDSRQTALLVGSLVGPLMVAWLTTTTVLFVLAPLGLAGAVAAMWMREGVWVVDLALARARFEASRMAGETAYRAQVWAPYPRRLDLPGVLAPTRLIETTDPRGPVGLVWNQRNGQLTATYLLSPAGALLADSQTVEHQVASWGNLLGSLANDAMAKHAAVTIELQPTSGTDLADHVAARRDPGAPEGVARIMDEVIAAAPTASTRVQARLSLTTDPSRVGGRTRRLPEAIAETLRSLGGLALQPAGVDVLRRASASDLAHIVRAAYDPQSEQTSGSAAWQNVSWGESGPVSAEEHTDHYAHENVHSMTWCLLEAPRQQVDHGVLLHLCSPGSFPRRVTLLYRTLSRDEAGAVLEREANTAAARQAYRQRTGRSPTQRENADAERANLAAMEEAHGAGLVQFSLFVTTTVADAEDLPEARREIEQAAGNSKLKLRLCRGGQAAAFATGLGVGGIYPADL